MKQSMTIACEVHFVRQTRGHRRLDAGAQPAAPTRPSGRVPRVTRLMALAIRFEAQVRRGQVPNYSRLAALGHVTRARMSQITNLTNLAPDIQEAILFLPRTEHECNPIHLRMLQPIATVFDWKRQRRMWQELVGHTRID